MKIDHHHIKARAIDYGRLGLRLAVQAGFLYALLTVLGIVVGGIGGAWGAQHFGYGFLVSALACVTGLGLGAFTGFSLAQMIVAGIIQDMLLSAGIRHGKTGLTVALKLLQEKRDRQAQKRKEETPPDAF